MSKLRIVLVTRRFWPLVGGAEVVMANLAEEFRKMDCEATIVTAQWETSWPSEFVHREVPVVRLPQPQRRGWGTFRYMAGLGHWLRAHRDKTDVVLVSMLKHSAYTTVGCLQTSAIPVLLRGEGAGTTGDCHWQQTARFGRRIRRRCQKADAVIGPSPAIVDELRHSGYPPEAVHFVANGVTFSNSERSPARKLAARAALAEVNPDLTISSQAPLILYTGRLDEKKGLRELVKAFQIVLKEIPQARLWIVGEGPFRERLYDQIVQNELRGRVLMPGAFDILDEVLAAADLYALPSHEEGMSLALLEAMAAAIPVVASDIPGNRQLITDDQNGSMVPVKNPSALAKAMLRILRDQPTADRLAAAGRDFSRGQFSSRRMAEDHLRLMEELVRTKKATV